VPSYSKRQQAQLKRFLEWVKTEGGVEGPTQLKTLFKPHQIARMEWLKANAAGYILEVGCNFSAVLAYMGGHVGIDISPLNIELARILSPDLEFHVGDAMALPFPDKAFQTVAVPETLEHLDFPEGVRLAIQEACRVSWQRVLITMPDGSRDTEEATSFKHRFLLDAPTLEELLTMLPPGERTSVEQTGLFVLIRHDLKETR
jgi:ubiquinone/menaquinone biosynthesis C-methylase UbiE